MKKKMLGSYINKKRKIVNLSSRQLAFKCNISPAYMCDIEKDKRIPKFIVLEKIASNLNLSEKEKHQMFDFAALDSESRVSYDLIDYIMNNDKLRKCIRTAIKVNNEDIWEKTSNDLVERREHNE